MAAREPLRLLLDADLSSHRLVSVLHEAGHDVLATGFDDGLEQLDDPILLAVAQELRRIVITHNSHDFPDILGEWAEASISHHGCMISRLPTNAYGELSRRFETGSGDSRLRRTGSIAPCTSDAGGRSSPPSPVASTRGAWLLCSFVASAAVLSPVPCAARGYSRSVAYPRSLERVRRHKIDRSEASEEVDQCAHESFSRSSSSRS